jgi:hypothetical protein
MEKKRSSQPILNDDERESSTKDLSSQISKTHKMPGTEKSPDDEMKKVKGGKKKW